MQATPKKAVTPNLVKARKPEMKRYLYKLNQMCSINCDVPYFDSLFLHHLAAMSKKGWNFKLVGNKNQGAYFTMDL
jgi:hypothetical protein